MSSFTALGWRASAAGGATRLGRAAARAPEAAHAAVPEDAQAAAPAPPSPAPARIRRLGPPDRASAAHVARAAFLGNPFYHAALGLDARQFSAYWDEFLRLALGDPRARVFGAQAGGCLAGVLVACVDGFPSGGRTAAYLAALVRRIGPRAALRYLRFVSAYERAMHRPRVPGEAEARGLWLMADPRAAVRVGPALVRAAIEAVRAEGCTLYTGFVDAGNERLLDFYRRQGFVVGPRFPFAGGWAAVVERRSC
ncbi:MAG TPA: GNAT family N-acetyltransferase [Candidatus Saccharimonadales bacterium]|nr:GNAT family N-acetyltransferase [Candidatus Saccharimonadales bacterium]